MEGYEAIDRSLFFTGAGFSFDAGCKTSIQMFRDIRQALVDDQDKRFSNLQKEALKFLITCLEYHAQWRGLESKDAFEFTPNIEELVLLIRRIRNRENYLPYPVTGNWSDKLVRLEAEYVSQSASGGFESDSSLFLDLERKLVNELLPNDWLQILSSDLEYLDPIETFLGENTTQSYKFEFFSLNNDLVVESFLERLGAPPYRGFANGLWQGVVSGDDARRVDLFKLHGSIDWVRFDDMNCWERDGVPESLWEQAHVVQERCLIFGHGTKTFSVEPFFSMINHFNERLSSADKRFVFVVGYSFFDPYINNLLFNAVRGDKRLIIVNPRFGPSDTFEELNLDDLSEARKRFFRAEYKEGKNPGSLSDYLREIQRNEFYSEQPDFNFVAINAENIDFLPITTELFLREFLRDDGALLVEYLQQFEEKSETPFTD